MHLEASILGYSDEPNTRVKGTQWEEGDKIYIRFSSTAYGVGTYTQDDWEFAYSGKLANISGAQCTVYYLQGDDVSVNETEITFSALTPIYSSSKAIYSYNNKTLSVFATLSPITSRMRFKGKTETLLELPKSQSLRNYTKIDLSSNELTSEETGLSLAVHLNGLTDYIYVYADQDVSFNVTSGDYITSEINLNQSNFKPGASGVVTISYMGRLLGNIDNTSPWWSAHTPNTHIAPGRTLTSTFTNYSGASNWNNFVIVLNGMDYNEYAIVRADNYGWGSGYDNNPNLITSGGQNDWRTWLKAMNGAKVTNKITNHGNGTADIELTMLGNDGVTYYQSYKGILVNSDDLWFNYTVDGCHLVFDTDDENTKIETGKTESGWSNTNLLEGMPINIVQYYATSDSWEPLQVAEYSARDGVYTIFYPTANSLQWQAQFTFRSTEIKIDPNKSYDFRVKIISTTKHPGVTIQLSEKDDSYTYLTRDRHEVEAYEGTWIELRNLKTTTEFDGKGIINNLSIVFDFGGIAANTTIHLSDMHLQEHED